MRAHVGNDVAAWTQARTLVVLGNASTLPAHEDCHMVIQDLLAHGAFPNCPRWLPMPVHSPQGQQLLQLLLDGFVAFEES